MILTVLDLPGKFRSVCLSSRSRRGGLFLSRGGRGGRRKWDSGGGRNPGRDGKWWKGRLRPGIGGRLGKEGLVEAADCRIESIVNPLAAQRRCRQSLYVSILGDYRVSGTTFTLVQKSLGLWFTSNFQKSIFRHFPSRILADILSVLNRKRNFAVLKQFSCFRRALNHLCPAGYICKTVVKLSNQCISVGTNQLFKIMSRQGHI